MMNQSNGDQIERNYHLVAIRFLEQCWQLEAVEALGEAVERPDLSPSLIEIDETGQGYPALSRSAVAMWVPLIWLYL